MTALAAVVSKLNRVTQKGETFTALCPAHEDRNPSLTGKQGDVRVVFTCHAGCSEDAILDALGLTKADLFDDKPSNNGNGTKPQVVATYDYVDEQGELLFQVVRKSDKTFPQRRPDGRGGWVWKLGDVRRVLYRLPAVIDAVKNRQTVWVTEGEKDVHSLERAGEVATCNPMGAAKKQGEKTKWLPEYSETLRDAHVFIVADDDAPGHAHAATVAQALEGIAASIDVYLPAAGHKDISDHLGAGLDLNDLRPMTDAPPWSIAGAEPTDELEWNDPIPLTDPDPPEFPIDVFGEHAPFLSAVATATQTPLGLVGPIALATISAALQGRVRIEPRLGWQETASLYVCCIAPPGEGKTPVFSMVTGPLRDLEAKLQDENAHRYAEAKTRRDVAEAAHENAKKAMRAEPDNRGLADALTETKKTLDATPEPAPFRLFIGGDTTPEALHAALAEQGGTLAVLTDEGAQLIENTVRYQSKGAPNLGVLIAGNDAGPLDSHRVGRVVPRVDRAVLTLGLTVQPVAITATDDAIRARGVLARVLWSWPSSNVGYRDTNPPTVNPADRDRWARALDRVARTDPRILGLSVIGDTEFGRWRIDHERRLRPGADLSNLADWANKHPGRWLRLAAIVHELRGDHGTETSADVAHDATRLCDYFTAHALKTFGAIGADPAIEAARVVLGWVTRHARDSGDGEPMAFTKRDAFNALRRTFQKADDLDAPLELLADRDWIRRDDEPREEGKPGRKPSPRYRINPAVAGLDPRDDGPKHDQKRTQNPQNPGLGADCADSAYVPQRFQTGVAAQ